MIYRRPLLPDAHLLSMLKRNENIVSLSRGIISKRVFKRPSGNNCIVVYFYFLLIRIVFKYCYFNPVFVTGFTLMTIE